MRWILLHLVTEGSDLAFVAGAVSVAFLGSWHCAGMCGAIAALAPRPKLAALYQLGRLLSYVCLGLLAGQFGETVLGWIPDDRKWIVSALLGLLSLWVLLSVWRLEFPMKMQRFLWRHRPRSKESLDFLSIGILNGFLPCHWLYGFVLVAAGTGSAAKGGALLFSLWLGSLPWLLGASSLGVFAKKFFPSSPWVARVLLVVVIVGLLLQGLMAGDPHLGCKLMDF